MTARTPPQMCIRDSPFVELNPYRDVLAQATQFVGYLPNVDDVTPDDSLGLDDMFEVVRKACEDYEGLQAKKEKKKAKIEELRAKQQLLSPFPVSYTHLPMDMNA